jgi:uncharacterized protein
MPFLETLSAQLLEAMKKRDSVRTSTLRMLIASLRNKEIERKKPLTDGEAIDVLQVEAKRRKESIEGYKAGNRADLVAKEEAELSVITAYLPEPMGAEELKGIVQAAIQSTGAKGPQDMGRVMSAVMPQLKGRADGKQAQQVVQQLLKP